MNNTRNIRFELKQIIEQGLRVLKEDMVMYGPVDFLGPYENKNRYIERANQLGVLLLRSGLNWEGEIYYSELLRLIREQEKENGTQYNKGIVFANLGLTQVRNDKFDEGVGYFIAADDEDRPFVTPDYTVLNTWLWDNFEAELIHFAVDTCKAQMADAVFSSDIIQNLFRGLSVEDRLFLSGSLWAIMKNGKYYLETPNKYTRGRLYSALSDTCLLSETLVRKKYRLINGITNEPRGFRELLDKVVPGCVHNKKGENTFGAKTPLEFSEKLSLLSRIQTQPSRWISCLLLTRNYIAHRFDYLTGMSATDDFFKDTYSLAVENSLSALLYLKSIDKI